MLNFRFAILIWQDFSRNYIADFMSRLIDEGCVQIRKTRNSED